MLSAIAHWIAFEMLNVPFSVPLALWVGIMSQFIPVVGTYIAGALPILITLIDTPRTGLFVLLVVLEDVLGQHELRCGGERGAGGGVVTLSAGRQRGAREPGGGFILESVHID